MSNFVITMDQVSREQEITLTAALKGICPATEVKGNILKTEANEATASVLRGMAMAFLKENQNAAISSVYRKTLTAWCDNKYYAIDKNGEVELIADLAETETTEVTESDEIEYLSLDDIDFTGSNAVKFDLDRWYTHEILELIDHTPSKIGSIDSNTEPLYSFIPATTNIARDRKDAVAIFRDRCVSNYKDWVEANKCDNLVYQYDYFYVGDTEYCVERKSGKIFAA